MEFSNDVYFGSSSTVIMPFTQLAGASAAAKVRGGGNGQAVLGVRVCICNGVFVVASRASGRCPFSSSNPASVLAPQPPSLT